MTREEVVRFAMGRILESKDWQDVQNAMANDERISAWIEAEAGGDELAACQGVIAEAEDRLGDRLPAGYA